MRSYYVERSRKKYLNNSLYFVNLILISDFDGIFKNSELKIGEKLKHFKGIVHNPRYLRPLISDIF